MVPFWNPCVAHANELLMHQTLTFSKQEGIKSVPLVQVTT